MEGYDSYQEWVLQTYGDASRTKTITLKKCARIQRVLRGEETACAENSKFRFWVRNKGFRDAVPPGYLWRPADGITGRYGPDLSLYVPSGNKDIGSEYKKVAIVENFYDIIYGVHVEIDGVGGKHAGQKRTYRTITETYAFLPREAVTKFLLSCSECQKRPNSPANKRSTIHKMNNNEKTPNKKRRTDTDISDSTPSSIFEQSCPSAQNSPENLSKHDRALPLLQSTPLPNENWEPRKIQDGSSGSDRETPRVYPLIRRNTSFTDSSDSSFENMKPTKAIRNTFEANRKGIFERNEIYKKSDSRFPICYPIPRYDGRKKLATILDCSQTESFGGRKEEVGVVPEAESPDDDAGYASTKDTEKLKMMLLAWNASGRNGEDIHEDAGSLWNAYHNPLSLSKQPPPTRSSPTQDAASVHDETSSSGNKDDDEDEEEESEEKIDPQKHDPERLKAFNMFVRLFVDENLDRIVPISKQPKEKIQAIIDSCTRQFPEFSERARKRIRTYLKSCRRNKRSRDGGPAWEPQSRPTPAHLTSVQAEQILAQACENESHNAKRMRLGMEPVTQPMPGATCDSVTTTRSGTTDTREKDVYNSPVSSVTEKTQKMDTGSRPASPPTSKQPLERLDTMSLTGPNSLSPSLLNGSGPPASVAAAVAAAAAAPAAMYRPNFSQAFQRAAAGYAAPGLFSLPCSLTNGPADLSMKSKPLLSHKLNPTEMTAVRQLVTGYRESAAFLLRSADELEQLLRNQLIFDDVDWGKDN